MAKVAPGLQASFDRLGRRTVDHVELRRAAGAVLRRHLGFDVAVVATVDPTTLMWTHCVLDGMARDEQLEDEVFANEYSGEDVLTLTDLLGAPGHAGTLRATAAGAPTPSERLHDIYGRRGLHDELRLLLVDGNSAWGALSLLRSGSDFREEEVRAVAAIGQSFAVSLRRSLLHAAVERPDSLDAPPGVIVCERGRGRVLDVSAEARALIDELGTDELPQVIASIRATQEAGGRAEAALATRSGRWLAFHATALGDRDVVIVEQVRAHRLADLIVRSHGLTNREREVVECVARGLSTKDIAAALFISEWTVQDHLKSVFAKFGVRSRQELVAAVFFDHYGPRHAAEDTPSPYGWYLTG